MKAYSLQEQGDSVAALAPAFPPRPLGYGEQLWLRLSEARSNNYVMVVQLVGRVDVEKIRAAMEQLVLAFPILRARVDMTQKLPCFDFARVAEVPLTILPRSSEDQWHRVSEQELNDRIAPTSPQLWRAVLLEGATASDLLLTFNHSIGDGQSTYTLVRELLECYANGASLPIMAPAPAYDELLAKSGLWRLTTQGVPSLVRQLVRARQPAVGAPVNSRVSAESAPHTKFLDTALDEATSAAVVRQSKRQGVSMHALLSSVFLLSAYEAMGGSDAKRIVMSAAINVRPKLRGEYPRDVGYFASGMESRYLISPATRLWPLGRQVDQDVKQQFTSDHIVLGLLLRRLILALKKDAGALIEAISKSSKTTIHLTNLGRADVGHQYGNLTLRRCFPIPSVHFVDKPVVCLAAVSFNKVLQLSFAYSAPLTDPVFVEALVARFLERLRLLADETASTGPSLNSQGD